MLTRQLQRNKIGGRLPNEIIQLQKLKDLSLGGNLLIGGIPRDYGNMPALEILSLEINKLDGPIPTTLENLKNLKILYFPADNRNLQNNQFEGPIPEGVQNIPGLLLTIDSKNENAEISRKGPNSTPKSASSGGSSSQLGTVIGYIAGACVFLLLIAALFMFWRKRRDSTSHSSQTKSSSSRPTIVTMDSHGESASKTGLNVKRPPDILSKGIPSKMLFIIQDTLPQAFIDTLDYLFLANNVMCQCHCQFTPTSSDEIEICPGDSLLILCHSLDGWVRGLNNRTMDTGFFPLICTTPRHTTKIYLVKSLLAVHEKIEAVALAFPEYLMIVEMEDLPEITKEMECYVSGDDLFVKEISSIFGGHLLLNII